MRYLVAVIAVLMLIVIVVLLRSGPMPARTAQPIPIANSFNLPSPTYIATTTSANNSERNSLIQNEDSLIAARITPHAIDVVLLNESTVGLLSSSGSLLGTAEPINFPENITDIFFSVKSTAKYHAPRLSLLLVTWLQTVDPSQLHIITDSGSDHWIQAIQSRGINITVARKCSSTHSQSGLCCKSGEEFKAYYMTRQKMPHKCRWFCHVDDDVYVNMVQLVRLLKPYDPTTQKLYFGHYPEVHWLKDQMFQKRNHELKIQAVTRFPTWKDSTFKYATGSTYCISSSLMNILEIYLK